MSYDLLFDLNEKRTKQNQESKQVEQINLQKPDIAASVYKKSIDQKTIKTNTENDEQFEPVPEKIPIPFMVMTVHDKQVQMDMNYENLQKRRHLSVEINSKFGLHSHNECIITMFKDKIDEGKVERITEWLMTQQPKDLSMVTSKIFEKEQPVKSQEQREIQQDQK